MSKGAEFVASLRHRVRIGDGAMGTELFARGAALTDCLERWNLDRPEVVRAIHAEYAAAGVELHQTNTFGANRFRLAAHGLDAQVAAVNRAGVALARAATAGRDAVVAGSIGPALVARPGQPPAEADERAAAYAEQAAALAEAGADLLLCETFTTLAEAQLALAGARRTGLPVVVHCVFGDGPDGGCTADGHTAAAALQALAQAGAAVVGANCGGTAHTELRTLRALDPAAIAAPLSACPNAGIPKLTGGRYVYQLDAAAQAGRALALAAAGARLIGGCCGTTPAHMAAVARALAAPPPARAPTRRRPSRHAPAAVPAAPRTSPLASPGPAPVLVVQLECPRDADPGPVVAAARTLAPAGPVLSLGDNPLGVARMDNVAVACRVREATGLEPMVHVSGRDRNALAVQSRLLGLHALDLRTLFLLTGDPAGASAGGHARATEVYDVTVYGLLELVAQLEAGVGPGGVRLGTPCAFTAGVGFNPNSPVLEGAVRRLERKLALGARFVLTQPLFTPADVARCADALAGVRIPVLCGVMPLRSAANADFVHAEVPGIVVPEAVRARLAGTPASRQADEGIALACEVAQAAAGRFAGLYVLPPFTHPEAALAVCETAQHAWAKARVQS